MAWQHLLSDHRPHGLKKKIVEIQRTPFERDFDRIVFSSAFRRLQDKTQVHPIPNTDYVRRRLTHSLEVSCVARSLGTFIGKQVCRRYRKSLKKEITPSSFGQITAAAALAHDIGNPPFGHIGETAIAEWFKQNGSNRLVAQLSEKELLDFTNFEGNAQGFRILSRTGNNSVGLKLTTATLAAFTKYPTSSTARDSKYVGHKKFGFFCDDFELFRSVAKNARLIQTSAISWKRHPLAFLVEAADDISYRIVDVEDGYKVGRLSFSEAEECLLAFVSNKKLYTRAVGDSDTNLGWLRAQAIGDLISEVQSVFLDNEKGILNGNFSHSLLDQAKSKKALKYAKEIVQQKVFTWDRTLKAEIAGARILSTLLGDFIEAATEPQRPLNKKLSKVIPGFDETEIAYQKLIRITDYISGMTDSFLMQTYRQIHGHVLN